ncbi:MAG: cytochrome c biogenesis protein CcsA [Herpetosiphon sp.]
MAQKAWLAQAGKAFVTVWMLAVTAAMFLLVPAQRGLGNTGRIIIFHIPTAWLSTFAFLISAIWSAMYLWKRRPSDDDRAVAAVEQGMVFTVLATVTGAIFAKVVWGAFWNWDPRQTSILVLLLIYGAYFALRSAIDDPERRRQLAAAYALFAFATAPFLTFVVPRLAESTLHPNCAFLETAACNGVTLGKEQRVGALGQTTLELREVVRNGDIVTAVVATRVGGGSPIVVQPSYNVRTGRQVDQPELPGRRFMLVIKQVNADGSLFMNQQAPGNESQLSNVVTLATFLASLAGFTGLFWWIWNLRVTVLGLRRTLGLEHLL